MNIIFDFDGTLIDSRERLYRLFQSLVPASKLSFDEYWNLKRNKISHEEILREKFAYSNRRVSLFLKSWFEQIELKQWLELDKPFTGVTDLLRQLSNSHNLYLVTSRQFSNGVMDQLNSFGWSDIFKKVLVTHQREDKYDLILRNSNIGEMDLMIGDTGADIMIGKKLGIHTVAVLTGFLSRQQLMLYKPDLIIDSVLELKHQTEFLTMQ